MIAPMMKCGHLGIATDTKTGRPACPICLGLDSGAMEVAELPDLSGRQAQCKYCGKLRPSSFDLPFFEWRGPGSPYATKKCKCGMYIEAHPNKYCDHFVPRGPAEYDGFYCGCRGWD